MPGAGSRQDNRPIEARRTGAAPYRHHVALRRDRRSDKRTNGGRGGGLWRQKPSGLSARPKRRAHSWSRPWANCARACRREQLFDQATGYFRNSGGRAYLHNLREEVVHNPVPITLIGAGIAWLALSGAMGRRGNGRAHSGRMTWRAIGAGPPAIADDLPMADAVLGHAARERDRSGLGARGGRGHLGNRGALARAGRDVGERVSTAYDETVGRARQTAEGWEDVRRPRTKPARLREGADTVRERAGELYERTAQGFRRVTRKASDYGRAARDAVRPDGALLNFCREQPMLVAGLGVAFGAALAAMIPASRVERQTMGEASRRVQDRIKETASDTLRAVGGERSTRDENDQSGRPRHLARKSLRAGRERRRFDRHATEQHRSERAAGSRQAARALGQRCHGLARSGGRRRAWRQAGRPGFQHRDRARAGALHRSG